MLKTYNISVQFRGNSIKAYVMDYETRQSLYFTDNDILKEVGGRFDIEAGKVTSHKTPNDAQKLYKEILSQIK